MKITPNYPKSSYNCHILFISYIYTTKIAIIWQKFCLQFVFCRSSVSPLQTFSSSRKSTTYYIFASISSFLQLKNNIHTHRIRYYKQIYFFFIFPIQKGINLFNIRFTFLKLFPIFFYIIK